MKLRSLLRLSLLISMLFPASSYALVLSAPVSGVSLTSEYPCNATYLNSMVVNPNGTASEQYICSATCTIPYGAGTRTQTLKIPGITRSQCIQGATLRTTSGKCGAVSYEKCVNFRPIVRVGR